MGPTRRLITITRRPVRLVQQSRLLLFPLEPENSRGTAVQHSKQPSSLAESQRGCRVRDGGGGKKIERGKAHTVVRAAHHKDRGHLTWQRASLASQLTREENSVRGRGIAHERERESRAGRGGIARRRQETRAWESGGAQGKIAAALHLPPCLRCFGVPILTLIGQIGSPIGHI